MATVLRLIFPALAISAVIAAPVQAAEPVEIQLSLKGHAFEPADPKAPANQPLLIIVTNADDTPEEFESSSLKLEKIVTPGSSIKLRLKGLAPGRYDFSGEYNPSAKGTLIIE